jgi:DHA1 family bicyclomycin/chloramphenicol resistance-like MFS transporter
MAELIRTRFLDRTTPPHILTLVLMAGMSAMNMSIFLPSLPAMTQEFGTDYAVMQLSVSVYLGCTALLQVMIGPISDRFGRRSVTILSLVIFVLATAGCYMSTSVEMFLAFRMLQATIAVGMVLSRAIVRDMYGQEESASMIGYVTMGMSIVPMIAPSIGGALDTAFGWRATFVFLMIFGSAMALLCWADQGETAKTTGVTFRQQVKDYPELFKSPRFWGYVFSAAFSSGTFFAFLGGAPYVATEVFNQPVAMTGFFLGVPAIGYALGNFLSGRYSVRYGINRMIVAGSIVQFVGLGLSLVVSYLGFGSAWMFFGFVTFVGLGNGLVLPNANAGLLSVRPHLAGTASGVGSAIMIGGGALLAAFAGAVLEGGNGSFPLQWIMFLSAIMGGLAIFYVIRRSRKLSLG